MSNIAHLSLSFAVASLLFAAGCAELPEDPDSFDTAALDTGADAADEVDEVDEDAITWGSNWVCETEGYFNTGWTYDAYGATVDFGRSQATWTGRSVNGIGSITVSAQLDGLSYSSSNPNPLSMTGAIKVGATTCGTVSVIDRDGTYSATASKTCSVSWNGVKGVTVKVQDSSAGARFEFIRGTDNHQFYLPGSGSSTTSCWYE